MLNCRNIFLSVFVVSLFSTVAHAVDATSSITGSYECTTDDPFSRSRYTSNMVVNKTGDTYAFAWDYHDPKMRYIGTGVSMTASDTFVAVIYSNSEALIQADGVSIYQVKPGGILEGDWTIVGKSKIGHEVCKKQMAKKGAE